MGGSMIIDLTTLTDEEVDTLREDIEKELSARAVLHAAASSTNNIIQQYQAARARGLPEGEKPEWIQPTGAHDSYPIDYEVVHAGKTWISLTQANTWEPGVSGWREVLPDGEISAWIQPTGAHDAYAQGAVVTHNEFTWVSDVDDNVWEPGVYGWTKQ
jgi:hypothetical protein